MNRQDRDRAAELASAPGRASRRELTVGIARARHDRESGSLNHMVAERAITILVIGGSRGTGLLVAQQLRNRGEGVRVLARNPERAASRLGTTVEVVPGDITNPKTLPPAIAGVSHMVFTAGVRSGRPARSSRVKETEYDGMLNTLTAAQQVGFAGRLVYLTSSGVTTRSLFAAALNLYKGNTLGWRKRAEEEIRRSGLDYTIVRAGVLLHREGGNRAIRVTQERLPLSLRFHIARADVAEVLIAALDHPCARRATFEVGWGRGPRLEPLQTLLDGLKRDPDEP